MSEKDMKKATIKAATENFRKLSKSDKQQVIAFMLGMIVARQNKTA